MFLRALTQAEQFAATAKFRQVFGRCILLFLECLSFHSGLTVILAQWLLLRRLGPVSLSLTTKMTIQRWWFHHFIQTFSGTNREHSSYIYLCPNIFCDSQNICYTIQVFCHITCDRWSLVMPSWLRYSYHFNAVDVSLADLFQGDAL